MLFDLLSFLFPNPCVCCMRVAGRNRFLCPTCEKDFSFYPTENACKTCGAPLSSESNVCGQCLSLKPAYQQLVVCATYSGKLRTALHRYKFYGRTDLAASFALMLSTRIRQLGCSDFDAVVPMPLSKERRRQRGFNQAERIARRVAKEFHVPCISNALSRKKDTKQQAMLHKGARRKNVHGAFALSNKEALFGKRILLVDDIFTTGATMREAAKMLSSSAASVTACVVARTAAKNDWFL